MTNYRTLLQFPTAPDGEPEAAESASDVIAEYMSAYPRHAPREAQDPTKPFVPLPGLSGAAAPASVPAPAQAPAVPTPQSAPPPAPAPAPALAMLPQPAAVANPTPQPAPSRPVPPPAPAVVTQPRQAPPTAAAPAASMPTVRIPVQPPPPPPRPPAAAAPAGPPVVAPPVVTPRPATPPVVAAKPKPASAPPIAAPVAAPPAVASIPPAAPTSPFVPKDVESAENVAATPRRRTGRNWAMVGLGILVVAQAAVIAALISLNSAPVEPPISAPPAASAPLSETPPPGPVTPAAAGLTPGATGLEPAPAAVELGRVDITSDPSGARVSIDGVDRGVTPLTVSIEPGTHAVVVSDGRMSTSRTLEVSSGATVTMMAALVPAAPAGPPAGWVTISSPLELQVYEDGNVLGTTSSARILLPAGRHELELVNRLTDFQTAVTVDVSAGRTSKVAIPLPNGGIAINALPWAEIWLDGKELGQTPVANQTVPIGTHEVIARHPQLGERKQTVVVTTKAPLRVVIDFNK
jgi:hypothetical protein